MAIETGLVVRMVYKLAYRQTEGFLHSIASLLGLGIEIPDYSTLCRRSRLLGKKLRIPKVASNQPIHLMIDSTGLRIHVGTARKPPKQRAWRKLHIAVDRKTGNIVASELTASRARDATRVPALLTQIQAPLAWAAADRGMSRRMLNFGVAAAPWRKNRSCQTTVSRGGQGDAKEIKEASKKANAIAYGRGSRPSLPMIAGIAATKADLTEWVTDSSAPTPERGRRGDRRAQGQARGTHNHWGSTNGELSFGGRRIQVSRPRVRSKSGEDASTLQSLPRRRASVESDLGGGIDPKLRIESGQTRGRSAASRHLVSQTTKKLEEYLSRRLES